MEASITAIVAHTSHQSRPGRLSRPERRAALAAPAPADGFVSRWQHAAGVRVHVRQRITGDAEMPCVLLHGLAVSHRYLMPTAGRLRGRSVYVPDLPGFGLSDKPRAVLDVRGHATAVAALMDALGVASAAILGNSFGAQVAVELAVRRPDLVAALILVGPTTDPAAATMTGQLRRLLRDLAHEDWRQAPILAADLRNAGPRRVIGTLRHAVGHRVDAQLPTIRVPSLWVRGSRDPIAPERWVDHAAAITPRGDSLTIDTAAHNVVATAGPQLATAVDAFLRHSTDPHHTAAIPGCAVRHATRTAAESELPR